jgi:hypothetical protein
MGDYFTAWQGKAEVAMEATYNGAVAKCGIFANFDDKSGFQ